MIYKIYDLFKLYGMTKAEALKILKDLIIFYNENGNEYSPEILEHFESVIIEILKDIRK